MTPTQSPSFPKWSRPDSSSVDATAAGDCRAPPTAAGAPRVSSASPAQHRLSVPACRPPDVVLVFRPSAGGFHRQRQVHPRRGCGGRPARWDAWPSVHRRPAQGRDLFLPRSRGLFAGVALDGAVLSIDHRANARAYGATHAARAVFEGRVKKAPPAVVDFRDRLEEYGALSLPARRLCAMLLSFPFVRHTPWAASVSGTG